MRLHKEGYMVIRLLSAHNMHTDRLHDILDLQQRRPTTHSNCRKIRLDRLPGDRKRFEGVALTPGRLSRLETRSANYPHGCIHDA